MQLQEQQEQEQEQEQPPQEELLQQEQQQFRQAQEQLRQQERRCLGRDAVVQRELERDESPVLRMGQRRGWLLPIQALLVVAILGIVMYNVFVTRVDSFNYMMDEASYEVLQLLAASAADKH